MAESRSGKKVVKASGSAGSARPGAKRAGVKGEPVWTPTPEAKSKATMLRIIAVACWVVAIGGEIATIVWILPNASEKLWLLIVAIVVIAIFALTGGLLWKKANRLDPASKQNKLKFWLWNQLGMIVTAVAFLPLIVLILLDKNMDGKQKGIAGGLAAVLAIAVGLATYDWTSPSQEQYAAESDIVTELTGSDTVYWTTGGKVFHVCADASDINRSGSTSDIIEGTVEDAHAQNKDRLTKKWRAEAVKDCGYTDEDVARVETAVPDSVKRLDELDGGSAPGGPATTDDTDSGAEDESTDATDLQTSDQGGADEEGGGN